MAVDADPSTEGIDTSASRIVAEEFDVSTNIAAVGTPYFSYWMLMEFDDDILAFVPVGTMNIVYTGLGNMWSDATALVQDTDSDGLPEVYGESARNAGTTPATGRANYVRFRCAAPGTTSLHFLMSSETTGLYTSMLDADVNFITTILQDAAITCSPAAPSPTPTATPLPGVGGIAELPALSGIQTGPSDASTAGPGPRAAKSTALALAATGAVAMAALAWYARRRRLR